jgi:peptidoglycan/LPS O-acetylase OafA/YrhL
VPTPQPSSAKETRGRVEALDLLRMVAVLAVMLFHYGFRGAAADAYTEVSLPELEAVAKYGYLGVQLFFVISGFVIAYSADGRTPAGFAIARIARIYPAFLFCMTVTFLATLALGAPRFQTTFAQWAGNAFILAPALRQPFMDGAYWSIVYEITFYTWIYLLMLTGLFRRRIDVVILLWLALSLLNELALDWVVLRKTLLTDQSGFFAAGLLLYEMYAGRRGALVHGLFAAAVACAAIEAVISLQWLRDRFGIPFDDGVVAGASVAAIGAVALLVRVRRLPLPAGLVVAIGGLTYPLYLLHQHVGYIALNRLKGLASAAVLVPAVTVGMVAVSWWVWRFADRPGQRRMKSALASLAHRAGIRTEPGETVAPAPRPVVTAPAALAGQDSTA